MDTQQTRWTIELPPGVNRVTIIGIPLGTHVSVEYALPENYAVLDIDRPQNDNQFRRATPKQKTPKVSATSNARSIAQRKRWAEQKRLQREAAKAEKAKAAKK
jgi:hypothetical protein